MIVARQRGFQPQPHHPLTAINNIIHQRQHHLVHLRKLQKERQQAKRYENDTTMNDAVKTTLKVANNIGTAMIANTYVHELFFSSSTSGSALTRSCSLHTPSLQQAIEKFHRNLSPDEISKLSASPPGPQSILNLMLEIDGKGKKRRLRRCASYFEPFLDSIQRYSQVVDSVVSSNPQIAGLVWGSVKVVIIVCLPLWNRLAIVVLTHLPGLSQFFRVFSKACRYVSDDRMRMPDFERIPGDLWGICRAPRIPL